MTREKRKRYFVDPKVQSALVYRAVTYWAMCMLIAGSLILTWRIASGPAALWYTHFATVWVYFAPAIVAAALLLPIIVLDTIKLSNRVVGPLVRLRRSLHALAAGQPVAPIRFRHNDFCQELADEFNAVLARIEQLEGRKRLPAREWLADEEDQVVSILS